MDTFFNLHITLPFSSVTKKFRQVPTTILLCIRQFPPSSGDGVPLQGNINRVFSEPRGRLVQFGASVLLSIFIANPGIPAYLLIWHPIYAHNTYVLPKFRVHVALVCAAESTTMALPTRAF